MILPSRGIVSAETLISIASDTPLSSSTTDPSMTTFMFPYIQGLLAFDTPYLGISPGVVAHGAETHYNTASFTIGQLSGLTGSLWRGKTTETGSNKAPSVDDKPLLALPEPESRGGTAVGKNEDAAAAPAWQRWGKIAMFAGAAGAVAAGGAAAYFKRDTIYEGWDWVGSHLEFVGCLMKGEELKNRMSKVLEIRREMEVGFTNFYTCLGKGATKPSSRVGDSGLLPADRTFCNLPKTPELNRCFLKVVNDAARDETLAHMSKHRLSLTTFN